MVWKIDERIEEAIPAFCLRMLRSRSKKVTNGDKFRAVHYLIQLRSENLKTLAAGDDSQPRTAAELLQSLKIVG